MAAVVVLWPLLWCGNKLGLSWSHLKLPVMSGALLSIRVLSSVAAAAQARWPVDAGIFQESAEANAVTAGQVSWFCWPGSGHRDRPLLWVASVLQLRQLQYTFLYSTLIVQSAAPRPAS